MSGWHSIKDAVRWASVWLSLAGAILIEAWNILPPDVKALIPPEWNSQIVSAMFMAVLIGRLKKQGA